MKNNNKGFMLLETLIVSCIVLGILVYMYTQFRNININYQRMFKYNTVSSLYKTNEIKKFIEADAYLDIVGKLENSSNIYLDITSCDILLYDSYSLCKDLYESMEIQSLLIMKENLSLVKVADISSLDGGMQNFVKYLSNNYTGEYYRIVASYKDGTYASVRISVLNKIYDYGYIGGVQTFTVPVSGSYQIELWGASGGNMTGIGYTSSNNSRGNLTYYGGKGAYTKGNIYLEKGTTLYLYVGGKGVNNISLDTSCNSDSNSIVGGYNGGGFIGSTECGFSATGGGATDIRLVGGSWDLFDSLKSRIMTAAGGGGANFRNQGYGEGNGGSGGALTGLSGEEALAEGSYWRSDYAAGYNIGTGGTQTTGGYRIQYKLDGTVITEATNGLFGKAVIGQSGAGSGYYSGSRGGHGGAGGGSSYISGYYGCNSISETSTESNIAHTNQTVHYSGLAFTNSNMLAGNEEMPNYNGGTMTGNSGNGYARITLSSY